MAPRKRLLDLLVLAFPEHSRDELYRLVMCGEVARLDPSGPSVQRDPRQLVPADSRFTIQRQRFVSRGGEKLSAALDAWRIDPSHRVWLDAGASTGGFTDCLLKYGAAAVHAVDVGYNQLDYRLRRNTRVIVRERTNVRDLSALEPPAQACVCDLSFRSLQGVLRHLLMLTTEGWGIALLKPQFEAASEVRWGEHDHVGAPESAGILSGQYRIDVVDRAITRIQESEGVTVLRRMECPLPGRRGNREELLLVGLAEGLTPG